MNAIDFVVRTGAGMVERDVVQPDATTTMLQMTSGAEISFNLAQSDMQQYMRLGDDLQITLADGRTIVLQDYFADFSDAPRLFVSSDGVLNEVFFAEGDSGLLYAEYGRSAEWGKWSPDDQLIHYDRAEVVAADAYQDDGEVSMLAAGLLGGSTLLGGAGIAGSALAGAALLGGGNGGNGGGGGGGGGAVRATPSVDDTAIVVGGDGVTEMVTITGTGEPGDSVTVTVGEEKVTTTIGDDGTWTATFEGDDFPAEGTYDAAVSVDAGGTEIALDGPNVLIDLTGPAMTVTDGTVEANDLLNAVGHASGLTVTGTGEAGTTVNVTIDGTTHSALVSDTGAWSVDFATAEIRTGEYTTSVTVTSQDIYGNSSTLTQTLQVDTESFVTLDTGAVAGDGTVNAAERDAASGNGLAIGGTAQAGSTVVLSVAGQDFTTNAGSDGTWSVTIPQSLVPTGETSLAMSVTATDTAGNVNTATGSLAIDTIVEPLAMTSTHGGSDGVVNIAESRNGLILSGTVEPGAQSLMVSFGGVSVPAVISGGTWNAEFSAAQIPVIDNGAAQVSLTAVDRNGNTRTETASIQLDTDAGYLTISSAPIEGDDIVNKLEAQDGVQITGTATPFAMVTVGLGASSLTVQANGAGQWSAPFSAAQIPADTANSQITATITDAAGNRLDASDSVAIDTVVDNYGIGNLSFGNDDVINAAEANAGVAITGTTEIGTQYVKVTVDGVTVNASVDTATGQWTATLPSGAFRQDAEYTTSVTVEAQDAAGNIAEISQPLKVDTYVNALSLSPSSGTADGVVNLAELRSDGLALSGTVEPGAQSVKVQFNNKTYDAQVAANGGWTLTIPGADVPAGEYGAALKIIGTDAAGNVKTVDGTVAIDTVAPEGPQIDFVLEAPNGVAGIFVSAQDEAQAVFEVQSNGTVGSVAHRTPVESGAQTIYTFNQDVPDGSHLVVTTADAAGNTRGTMLVLEDGAAGTQVDMANANLGAMNIDTIQLEFAEDSQLTLTEADIVALSSETNTVMVTGGSDDQVTLAGATRGNTVTDANNDSFVEYTLGDATILVDSDITNVVI